MMMKKMAMMTRTKMEKRERERSCHDDTALSEIDFIIQQLSHHIHHYYYIYLFIIVGSSIYNFAIIFCCESLFVIPFPILSKLYVSLFKLYMLIIH